MIFTEMPSPPRRSLPVEVRGPEQSARRLFGEETARPQMDAAAQQDAQDSWRMVDRLLNAGSEDGVRFALQIADERQLPMGVALRKLQPSQRSSALMIGEEERQLFEKLVAAARCEIGAHINALDRRVDSFNIGLSPTHRSITSTPSSGALQRPVQPQGGCGGG